MQQTTFRKLWFFRLTLIALTLFSTSSHAKTQESNSPSIHALLIGINQYHNNFRSLNGSVNDVNLIEESLLRYTTISRKNIHRLTNQAATKEAIRASWHDIVENKAKKGDTLIFHFSGHGFSEYDSNQDELQRDPNDRFDEVLILGGFSSLKQSQLQQRILDDELAIWFKEATDQGMKVIFLPDTCYSGDSYRNDGAGEARSLTRGAKDTNKLRSLLSHHPIKVKPTPETRGKLYAYTAASDTQLSIESIFFKNEANGYLSWFFSQSLQYADKNEDQILQHNELANYLSSYIQKKSRRKMMPDVTPELSDENTITLKSSYSPKSEWPKEALEELHLISPFETSVGLESSYSFPTTPKLVLETESFNRLNVYYIIATFKKSGIHLDCGNVPKNWSYKRRLKFDYAMPNKRQIVLTLVVKRRGTAIPNFMDQYIHRAGCLLTPKIIHEQLIPELKKTPYYLGIAESKG